MSWLSSIGIDLCRPRSGGGGTPTPSAPNAPVITQESVAGATPFKFSWIEDTTIVDGYYIGVQTAVGASVAAAKANLTGGTLRDDVTQQLSYSDLLSPADIVLTGLQVTPSGTSYALWARFGYDAGDGTITWGGWSNQIGDDIAATSSAVLATVTGTNKSPYVDVTGSPALIAAVNNVIGATVCVRTATTALGKKHLEVTINHITSLIELGLIESTTDMGGVNTNHRAGASGKANGCSMLFDTTTSTVIFANGATAGGTTPALAAGDKIVFEFDNQTNPASVPVNIWHRRSTTDTVLATLTLTSQIPTNLTFYGGGATNASGGDGFTVEFGAGTFAKTPTSGFGIYG